MTILLSIQVCLCDIRVPIESPDHSFDMWVLFAPVFVILTSVLCFVFFFFFFNNYSRNNRPPENVLLEKPCGNACEKDPTVFAQL